MIGYAKKKVVSVTVEGWEQDPDFIVVPDGKGGQLRIPRMKKSDDQKQGKGRGKRLKAAGEGPQLSPVFSEASTDEDVERLMLAAMSDDEKQDYIVEKKKRKADREKRRKEKYGEEYTDMKAENQK